MKLADLHDLITSSELGQLYLLVTTPLGDTILDHSFSCQECKKKIGEAGENYWDSLSEKERVRYRDSAQKILAKLNVAT